MRTLARRLLGILALASLLGCGADDIRRVAPADAAAEVPLRGASIVAADEGHLWMTDRAHLATYDRADERWSLVDLPWSATEVDELDGEPVDGGLALLVSYCDGPCERMRENLVGLAAFFSPSGRELRRLDPIEGPEHYGGIATVRSDGDRVAFATDDGSRGWRITVDRSGAKVTSGPGADELVCAGPKGYVVVRHVDRGTPGSVGPPDDPRPDIQALVEGIGSKLVLAGPTEDQLAPVGLPGPVRAALGDVTHLGTACLPDGLALLQADGAWELRAGSWTKAPGRLDGTLMYLSSSTWIELPDGTVVIGGAERTPGGTWQTRDWRDEVAVMGDVVVHHRFEPS